MTLYSLDQAKLTQKFDKLNQLMKKHKYYTFFQHKNFYSALVINLLMNLLVFVK